MPIPAALRITICALLAVCPSAAQESADRIEAAIRGLDDASPAVRARARSELFRIGDPALAALRSILQAPQDLPPEVLLVRAEQVGAERRSHPFVLTVDRRQRGWRIAWCDDGSRLALLTQHGGELLYLDRDLEPIGDAVPGAFSYLAAGPEGALALADRHGGGARIMRPDGDTVRVRTGQDGGVTFSPDGRLLATGGYGREVRVMHTDDGREHRQFGVRGTVGGLTPVFSPDGKTLAVGNRNDRTTLIDVETGQLLHELERRQSQELAFSPDGRRLAIGYVDGRIGIWDVATGTLEKLLESGCEEVFTVTWSPDGALLATAGLGGPIEIWSARHLARLHALDPESERTFRIRFRPDGQQLVAAGNGQLRAWRIGSAEDGDSPPERSRDRGQSPR